MLQNLLSGGQGVSQPKDASSETRMMQDGLDAVNAAAM